MTPIAALRTLEQAADRIREGPQTGPDVIDALRALRGRVKRERLLYLWEYLRFDAKAEPSRLIGVEQNLNAGLNGLARDVGAEREY